MGKPSKETGREALNRIRRQSLEEWHANYKALYPDITRQETARIYPLFLQALNAETREEKLTAWARYIDALKPIEQRNQGGTHGRRF